MRLKRLAVVMAFTVVVASIAVGCGSGDDVKVIEGTQKAGSETATSADYVFNYQGTDITVDADFAPILEKLGEPNSYFESESCAAQGIGKNYSYTDFEIETYPDGDTDRVLYVMLKSDAVSTAEGINLNSSKDDVIAAYGEPTKEVSGSLIYETGSMKLKFLFNEDGMVSIEYDSLKA